jgi:hypothetical protein
MSRRYVLVVQSLRIAHFGQADDQYLRIAMPFWIEVNRQMACSPAGQR